MISILIFVIAITVLGAALRSGQWTYALAGAGIVLAESLAFARALPKAHVT